MSIRAIRMNGIQILCYVFCSAGHMANLLDQALGRTFKQFKQTSSSCSWCGRSWLNPSPRGLGNSHWNTVTVCGARSFDALLSISLGRSILRSVRSANLCTLLAFSQWKQALHTGPSNAAWNCIMQGILCQHIFWGNFVDSIGTCEMQAPVYPPTCQEKIYFVVSRAH